MRSYIHGCDVVLVGFSDFLHDLYFGQTAGVDGAFDGDGSLWVVQGQVLQTAHMITPSVCLQKAKGKPRNQKYRWEF